ncbi:MAG: beta-ketoacyl-ACP synthase III [Myxococcota bacterium]|nr:beta-ketoacyl-ACP synthase III [Myxococcota bacterium]
MSVYLTQSACFLPGEPVDNERIETVLGRVHGKPSKLKRRILKSNGIITRHYAIDEQQQTTVQNEEMAVAAGKLVLERAGLEPRDIGMLAVATTQGDYVLPGFGSQVQAGLEIPRVELLTTHGICSCAMMALKGAFNAIKLGDQSTALVISSELCSRLLKRQRYEAASDSIGAQRGLDFNAEFLRWMLSDGAGALLLADKPASRGLSLRIDWIRSFSHADSYPVCMSVGNSGKGENAPKAWQDYETYAEAEIDGALLIRQDVRLLEHIVKLGVDGFLALIEEGVVDVPKIDHFLCHYSSHYFRGKIVDMLSKAGAMVPEERWFTNLYTKGNTGCAAMFIMLDEFLQSGKAQAGETVFCHVPESGRFNTVYMQLTCVEAA